MKTLSIIFIFCLSILITTSMAENNDKTTTSGENKNTGYTQKEFPVPVKRYCQTLKLKEDMKLMEEYKMWHAKVWPEVLEGIKKVGILDHEIYIHDNILFMILVTPVDFDFDTQMTKLASLPRQSEWEEFMSKFQNSDTSASSSEKWTRMERIFNLN